LVAAWFEEAAANNVFTLCGDGLWVGFDSGDQVSRSYRSRFTFAGGKILSVTVDVSAEAYLDLETERWRRSRASAHGSPWSNTGSAPG
jgi:arylsulfatase